MRKILITTVLAAGLCTLSYGQVEKEIVSRVKNVTIYRSGAQVENEATAELKKGMMILKFTGLSPYIRKESIRVEGNGSFIIQSVRHQTDYLNELEKNREISSVRTRINLLRDSVEYDNSMIRIMNDKIDFLKTNKDITGKDRAIDPEVFRSLNSFYGNSLETLTLDLMKRGRILRTHEEELAKLNRQLEDLNNMTDMPSGTIIVAIEARQTVSSPVRLSYIVDRANWYPTYDIRFTGTGKPLAVTFKANISQQTGIDWKDVNLVLSTAQTDISAQIPGLSPNYLSYYVPRTENTIATALQGRVAGVSVEESPMMAKSAISIRGISSVSGDNKPLYVVDGIPVDDISYLNPEDIASMNVLKNSSATSIYGSRGSNGVVLIDTKKNKEVSSVPLTVTSQSETISEFIVDGSQTILSGSKTNTVAFRETSIDAEYEYQTVPLLSEHVYLIGKIKDWHKADLLDGDASIYMENSFVGTSTINTQQFSDTLDISFGADNNISIKREKLTDFSEDQFIGVNRKVTLAYKITVRNNKAYSVPVLVRDQVPVSTIKDIQVEPMELSGGKINTDTGEVIWKTEMKPGETKELILKFSVKYPKDKTVIIR